MKRILAATLFLLLGFAASEADTLRDFLKAQTRYWGIEKTISAADMDKLVDLKQKADRPGLTREERTTAYTDLFHFVQKLRGLPEGRVPAAMAAGTWSEGQSPLPPQVSFAKPKQVGNFTKRGAGTIPMILIPDLGADWTVFDSFMERNQQNYTFYAVTLPGFGGTAPPPPHEKFSFGDTQWWSNAEAAILDLIAKQKLKHPVILGHQAGAYLAMKLALKHPEIVRGAIVLNGLLYAPLPGMQQNVTPEERVRFMNNSTPVELFPNPTQAQYRAVFLQYGPWNCKDKKRQESLADMTARSGPYTWWNYFVELQTTDLSKEIKTLKVPMLVLPSVYDQAAGGMETSKMALDQWNPLDHSISSLPITVIRMEDCNGYAMEDQPAQLDKAVQNWIAKL